MSESFGEPRGPGDDGQHALRRGVLVSAAYIAFALLTGAIGIA